MLLATGNTFTYQLILQCDLLVGLKDTNSDSVSFNDTEMTGIIQIILHHVKTLLLHSHISLLSMYFQTVCPTVSTQSHSINLILLLIFLTFCQLSGQQS